MTHAIRFEKTGGPQVLEWQSVAIPPPGAGEALIRHTAVGLNFLDTYHRSGLYPVALPSGIGVEAAGIIEMLGEDVKGLTVGDRVAYATAPLGAYSEARICPVSKLVRIPAHISDEQAAAVLLKGMTVEVLFRRAYRLKKGDTILFHAIAGGVGLLACQWAKAIGCTVIGTAGSPEKAELARANGCQHVVLYREENVVETVNRITAGAGVPVVYDSVGKDTFDASVGCLGRRGMLVSFGQSSGPVPEKNLAIFAPKSLYYTRPSIFNYCATPEELKASAREVFKSVRQGRLKVQVRQRYPLKDAARAHEDLEARRLTGSTILIP